MFVTSSADRAGIFVAIVSGGRPTFKLRPTRELIPEVASADPGAIAWVVNERDVPDYEVDGTEIVAYPNDWAFDYASENWTSPDRPPTRDGFLGVFPGREWACREAERRGCWAVLMLDDNITDRYWLRATRGGKQVIRDRGGLRFYTDLLAAVTLSTNARMVGAQLSSVASSELRVARAGFPYSLFIERVGEGREPWVGLFEEDIFHALQYGDRADGATAAVLPLIRYEKDTRTIVGGMRAHYDSERSRSLQALNPATTRVGVRKSTSNGRGLPRVFHSMPPGAIRNPLVVTDPELYGRTKDALVACMRDWTVLEREGNLAKARERLAKHQG